MQHIEGPKYLFYEWCPFTHQRLLRASGHFTGTGLFCHIQTLPLHPFNIFSYSWYLSDLFFLASSKGSLPTLIFYKSVRPQFHPGSTASALSSGDTVDCLQLKTYGLWWFPVYISHQEYSLRFKISMSAY